MKDEKTLLRVADARKTYGRTTIALDGVTLSIAYGDTFGLVGESGSGKSTLARSIAGLEQLDSGTAQLDEKRLPANVDKRSREILRRLQMVFQDPDSTLNPAHTVRTILDRSLKRLTELDRHQREARMTSLLEAVQLDPGVMTALPGQLSGGQKQRIAIARAFAGSPSLVLCDEPVSSLDVSVQAAILNLLDALQRAEAVSYLFISHDIGVVRYLADQVGVLYGGRLVEVGPAEAVFAAPNHPYTALLLNAAAAPESFAEPNPEGCVFHTRCPRTIAGLCETQPPPWQTTETGAQIRCHIPLSEL